MSKSPELTRSQFDGTWRAGNGGLVTIHGHMCSLLSKFQVDVASRTCTGTVDGNTFSGMLQGDGHGMSWSDGDTWTLMDGARSADLPQQQPARSNSRETHTPTQTADSEDSGKRKSKETDSDRHRHRTKRPPNTRTRRADARTTRYDRTANTRKKTESSSGHTNPRHTVTLIDAPTWYPQSPSQTHTEKTLTNKHNRKHPAGAHPIPWQGSRSSTTAQPALGPKWAYAPMHEKEEPKEAPPDPEIHFVVEKQTNTHTHTHRSDTSELTMALSPPSFKGKWSTSNKTFVIITNNTCEIFRSFTCNPHWRACIGSLGTKMFIGKLSDDGRVIHWDNGNTWIKHNSLHLTASYGLTEQSRWWTNEFTTQHPAPNRTQHLTPYNAVEATNAVTRKRNREANERLLDTPDPKKTRSPTTAHSDEQCFTLTTDSGTAPITIVEYDVLGRQLKYTVDRRPSWIYKADQPTSEIVIVDCTNLNLIRHSTPTSAHGSSKDIYTWLDEQELNFPILVKQSLLREGDAVLHPYTHKGQPILVIHITNPDFRETVDATCTEVAEKLTRAYFNILTIFLDTKKQHLRIQPIAGGLYAGSFLATLPTLTVAAMNAAFQNLPLEAQETLSRCKLELCVTYQGEHKHYVTAFKTFGNKSYKEQTEAAQKQHQLQKQRSTIRKPKLVKWHKRRPQQGAPTPPYQYHQL